MIESYEETEKKRNTPEWKQAEEAFEAKLQKIAKEHDELKKERKRVEAELKRTRKRVETKYKVPGFWRTPRSAGQGMYKVPYSPPGRGFIKLVGVSSLE